MHIPYPNQPHSSIFFVAHPCPTLPERPESTTSDEFSAADVRFEEKSSLLVTMLFMIIALGKTSLIIGAQLAFEWICDVLVNSGLFCRHF
jgi:hypothetical protein